MQHTNTSSMSGDSSLDHESILSRSGLWAKILGEEPLFSCMGLSFEERFGNVAMQDEQIILEKLGLEWASSAWRIFKRWWMATFRWHLPRWWLLHCPPRHLSPTPFGLTGAQLMLHV